ncbi:hypothetical protein A6452_41435 [Bradyrhizobium elkanii]|nr:hypothetical protein A6452_41435 [Bradyrhizobium elkanii]
MPLPSHARSFTLSIHCVSKSITPLDAGKTDNSIILIVFKNFRASLDHFLHSYSNRFGVEDFDWYKPWCSLHDLCAWQDALFSQGSRRPKAYAEALGGLGEADELPIAFARVIFR